MIWTRQAYSAYIHEGLADAHGPQPNDFEMFKLDVVDH